MDSIDLGSTGLRATKESGVLRVVLDRPARRNACTIEMYHGIKKAAVLAERDPEIDVVVLTGTGEYFCVGGEMGGKHEGGQPLDRETDGLDLTPFVQLERCPKIILTAINGMCQGGGLVMTLMSDVSVVSDHATFRVPELLRGVADCYLGARLSPRIGIARAKYLLFTAQYFSAAEALA
ncbi:MAG: enoyl-CoA hydratase/isomerase family protein, partial [Candidatus Binatia bacterium]